MAYVEINGVPLLTQPTEIIWQKRDILGYDGTGHVIYAAHRAAQLKWDLMSVEDFGLLRENYESQSATGTVLINLPMWASTTFGFTGYVANMHEPEVDAYFMGYLQKVSVMLTRILA